MHEDLKRTIVNKDMTKKEVAQNFRKRILGAIRHDKDLIVDLNNMIPPLKTDYEFPDVEVNRLLNRKELRNEFITKKAAGNMDF